MTPLDTLTRAVLDAICLAAKDDPLTDEQWNDPESAADMAAYRDATGAGVARWLNDPSTVDTIATALAGTSHFVAGIHARKARAVVAALTATLTPEQTT